MAFDDEGNLYVGSGDSNSSGGSTATPATTGPRSSPGPSSFQDARRTAGQHERPERQDHPDPPGGRTALHDPGRQPVPGGRRPGDKTRPEIYVMGVRNIARLEIDPETDWLTAGWVGPDARPEPGRSGPAKYETADDHHLGGQPRLAVLHGQQAAVPRPQQHRRDRADRLVRLRQPEEQLAAQHRPGRPAAGQGQHDLVLAGTAAARSSRTARRQRPSRPTTRPTRPTPSRTCAAAARPSCPGRRTTATGSTPTAAWPGRSTGTTSGSSVTSPTRQPGRVTVDPGAVDRPPAAPVRRVDISQIVADDTAAESGWTRVRPGRRALHARLRRRLLHPARRTRS